MGFWLGAWNVLNWFVVNTSLRVFHVLFYNIKYVSILYMWNLKLWRILKKAVADKWLNETGDIKRHWKIIYSLTFPANFSNLWWWYWSHAPHGAFFSSLTLLLYFRWQHRLSHRHTQPFEYIMLPFQSWKITHKHISLSHINWLSSSHRCFLVYRFRVDTLIFDSCQAPHYDVRWS